MWTCSSTCQARLRCTCQKASGRITCRLPAPKVRAIKGFAQAGDKLPEVVAWGCAKFQATALLPLAALHHQAGLISVQEQATESPGMGIIDLHVFLIDTTR